MVVEFYEGTRYRRYRKDMKKEKKVKPTQNGCACCPSNTEILDLDTRLYQSFGGYHVTQDNKLHFMDTPDKEWNDCKQLSEIEKEAAKHPKSDWRVHLDLPLRSGVWQRHQKNKWCLIESGIGFA